MANKYIEPFGLAVSTHLSEKTLEDDYNKMLLLQGAYHDEDFMKYLERYQLTRKLIIAIHRNEGFSYRELLISKFNLDKYYSGYVSLENMLEDFFLDEIKNIEIPEFFHEYLNWEKITEVYEGIVNDLMKLGSETDDQKTIEQAEDLDAIMRATYLKILDTFYVDAMREVMHYDYKHLEHLNKSSKSK